MRYGITVKGCVAVCDHLNNVFKNDSQGVILKRFLYILVFFIKFMTLRFNNVITIDLNDVPFNFHMALNNFKETPINYNKLVIF